MVVAQRFSLIRRPDALNSVRNPLAESQKPTLAVMDVRLGGERDGIHVAMEIFRKLGIRCIFATAHYDQHSLERAKPAMPLGWLEKPYSMVSLINAVHRALRELNP